MSKKCKNASKLRNLQRKRARKSANKAKWQAMALSGVNSKSKRFRSKNKRMQRINPVSHKDVSHCGNPACSRCFTNVDGNIRKAA